MLLIMQACITISSFVRRAAIIGKAFRFMVVGDVVLILDGIDSSHKLWFEASARNVIRKQSQIEDNWHRDRERERE